MLQSEAGYIDARPHQPRRRKTLATHGRTIHGGQVEEGDRVLAVLNEIKLLHQLITVVPHGKLCASMCIPISLQGEDRLATRASLWIFHEAAQRQANGQQRTDHRRDAAVVRKCY